MDSQKRATIYLDADVHRALRLKAAASDRSISEIVNDAVKATLAEDAEDLAAFSERKDERSVSFDAFVQGLRRRGRIEGPHQDFGGKGARSSRYQSRSSTNRRAQTGACRRSPAQGRRETCWLRRPLSAPPRPL